MTSDYQYPEEAREDAVERCLRLHATVDNRYTGVGYESPFETPSDKDFMSAHIESLEAEIANWKGASIDSAGKFMKMLEEAEKQRDRADKAKAEIAALRERQRVLVEALEAIAEGCSFPENEVQKAVVTRARAALAAKEG